MAFPSMIVAVATMTSWKRKTLCEKAANTGLLKVLWQSIHDYVMKDGKIETILARALAGFTYTDAS